MVGKALWQNLKVLVDFDRQILSIDKEVLSSKNTISELTAQISKIKQLSSDKITLIDDLKKKIGSLEKKSKILEEEEYKKTEILDNMKKQQEYKSVEREIDFIRREKMDLDNQITEGWYKLENIENSVKNESAKNKEQIEDISKDIQGLQECIQRNLDEKIEVSKLRLDATKNIPAEWLARYEKMKHSVENPIIPIINDCCGACYYAVLRQDLVKIKQAGVLLCRNCYRFLYYDNEEQKDLQQPKF